MVKIKGMDRSRLGRQESYAYRGSSSGEKCVGSSVNCRLIYIFMTQSPCLKCAEEISTKATRCPNCGYEPKRGYESEAGIAKLWGFLISLTIVGVIVGIPLWWYGMKCQKKAREMKPTNTEPNHITAPPHI